METKAKEASRPSRKAKAKPKTPAAQEPGPWSDWIPNAQDARFFYRARLMPDGEYEYQFSPGYPLAAPSTGPVCAAPVPSPPAATMPYAGDGPASWQIADPGPAERAIAPVSETFDRVQQYAIPTVGTLVRCPPVLAGTDDGFSPSMAVVPVGRREKDHRRPKPPKQPKQPTFLMMTPWLAHSRKLGNKVKSEKEINVHSNNRVKVWLKDVAEPGPDEWDRLSS
ncbi:hypothetical protein B0T22DRAFT_481953 [Podospora appendiculata]|uniref:Uncharacterized protein n=1 Tax=Podospora appendiculata TaxID=314037 RepID=A0AAE1C9W2_9PEZI|nr:hypothetical protein B0T22DRAFT_481953 [Podospora appendiculata]